MKFVTTSSITLVLSLSGMLYHIYHISDLYFLYKAVTEIEIGMPITMSQPSLTICMYYPNFLNWSQLEKLAKERGQSLNLSKYPLELSDVETFLEVQDIFALSPEPCELLSGCKYRVPGEHKIRHRKEMCKKAFSIEKFFFLHGICYRFRQGRSFIRNQSKLADYRFTFYEIKNYVHILDLFFEVSLQSEYYKHATYIEASIFSSKRLPQGSNAFSVSFKRTTSLRNEQSQDFYYLSYSMIVSHNLPYPYERPCIVYSKETSFPSRNACLDECIIDRMDRRLGKVPFNTVIKDTSLKRYVISITDFKNETVSNTVATIDKECHEVCRFTDCIERIYSTKLERSESSDRVRFRVQPPSEPQITTHLYPNLTTNEYIIYMLNCFGIWLGLSVMDLEKVAAYLGNKLPPSSRLRDARRVRFRRSQGARLERRQRRRQQSVFMRDRHHVISPLRP